MQTNTAILKIPHLPRWTLIKTFMKLKSSVHISEKSRRMRREGPGRNVQPWQKKEQRISEVCNTKRFPHFKLSAHVPTFCLSLPFTACPFWDHFWVPGPKPPRPAECRAMAAAGQSCAHCHPSRWAGHSLQVREGRSWHRCPAQPHCPFPVLALQSPPRAASPWGASPVPTPLKSQRWKSQGSFVSGTETLCQLTIRTISRAKPRHKGYLLEWRVFKRHDQEFQVMRSWCWSCPGFLHEGQCTNLREKRAQGSTAWAELGDGAVLPQPSSGLAQLGRKAASWISN